jgi:hypothetical protein
MFNSKRMPPRAVVDMAKSAVAMEGIATAHRPAARTVVRARRSERPTRQ